MAWLELSLIVAADRQADVEAALEDLGALAVTLLDAEDHPIFEPAPGETPMWPQIAMSALFEADSDRAGLVHVLTELVADLAPEQIGFRIVEDQDWTRVWMDQFQPMRFGRRLWIYPWNVEPPGDEPDAIVVRLDPGLAFGTGTHPTTALCLEWLDALDLNGKTVLDYGCRTEFQRRDREHAGAAAVVKHPTRSSPKRSMRSSRTSWPDRSTRSLRDLRSASNLAARSRCRESCAVRNLRFARATRNGSMRSKSKRAKTGCGSAAVAAVDARRCLSSVSRSVGPESTRLLWLD